MVRECEGSHYEPRLADGFAKMQFKSAIVGQICAQDESLLVPGPTRSVNNSGQIQKGQAKRLEKGSKSLLSASPSFSVAFGVLLSQDQI